MSGFVAAKPLPGVLLDEVSGAGDPRLVEANGPGREWTGAFYAVTNRRLFRPGDPGESWEAVGAPLPGGYRGQSPHAIVATP